MNKYKITRNKKPLTQDDVQKGQDFGALMKTFHARKIPFYKTRKFYLNTFVAAVFLSTAGFFVMRTLHSKIALQKGRQDFSAGNGTVQSKQHTGKTKFIPAFIIRFDVKEFPELATYRNISFEVDTVKTPYNAADKNIAWENVKIERAAGDSAYSVTFTKGNFTRTYITRPREN